VYPEVSSLSQTAAATKAGLFLTAGDQRRTEHSRHGLIKEENTEYTQFVFYLYM
jgi:phage portal protein BeeE